MRDRTNDATIQVDKETDNNLAYLRNKLNSPKKWIIQRLVAEEMAKYRKPRNSGSSNKKKSLEVAK